MTDYTDNRRLSAFFDTRETADDAVSRLRALGLSDASVRVTGGDEVSTRLESSEPSGFWDSISDFFFPDEDRATYAEGLRRGGYLVTVSGIPAERFDEAVDILDDEGSVDLDERSESWRSEGWTGSSTTTGTTTSTAGLGTSGAAYGASTGQTDSDLAALGTDNATTRTPMAATASAGSEGVSLDEEAAAYGTRRSEQGDEVIPVIEERLRVGKRDAALGRVRVRSYVVEQPVTENVDLRSERVEIERRPVDRALEAGDQAFVDRTIEAEERVEEAVVQKEARVTEEIGLRKTAEERTETVSDTVRRTEVEVEDERETLKGDTLKTDPGARGA